MTSEPGWQDRYQVDIYQLGWRLGGKGASGRNAQIGERIEEHGLHIWFGFYENAFNLIQRCYVELNRPPGSPLATWQDAFKQQNWVVGEEHIGDRWIHDPQQFPTNDRVPGSGGPLPTVWEYLVAILRFLHDHVPLDRVGGNTSSTPVAKPPWWDRLIPDVVRDIERVTDNLDRRFHLEMALRLAERLPLDVQQHRAEDHQAILWLLDSFLGWAWERLGEDVEAGDYDRRVWILLDLGIAAARGAVQDGLVYHGFDAINDVDFAEWLEQHGASDLSRTSAFIRVLYDLLFAFRGGDIGQPNIEAGTCLRGMLRLLFTYDGAIMWKMQAGMGDTIFTPLYTVLKRRGVKFHFFHRVVKVEVSADATQVERITLKRQVTLTTGEYDPLVNVAELPCWPSTPRYEQVVEREALQSNGVNLESAWTTWPDRESLILNAGVDFDSIILGISLGGLPLICADLVAANAAWRQMVDHVLTVRTQAFQLWLAPSLSDLGWQLGPAPVVSAYAEPLDTLADMSHLLDREVWPATSQPQTIAYFCGPMPDSDEPPYFTHPDFPDQMQASVKQNVIAFLQQHTAHLWPAGVQPGTEGLNWQLLMDPHGRSGIQRLDGQFWRANIDPTERYVLSVVGSTQFRLPSDRSGFSNLYLAGDWTRNGLNAGCVEAAVMSGKQCARAISGAQMTILGEVDAL